MFNANEIRQITFEKVVRGYRPEDVESFMEKIADEFEALVAEKQEIEGLRYIGKNILTIQFYPEDAEYIYDEFIKMM